MKILTLISREHLVEYEMECTDPKGQILIPSREPWIYIWVCHEIFSTLREHIWLHWFNLKVQNTKWKKLRKKYAFKKLLSMELLSMEFS